MVALTAEGCSDTGFQSDEDCFENQNTSGNDNSLRSRVVQIREQEKAKQGKEQVTTDQNSSRKDEDEEEDQETHQKGVWLWRLRPVC